jgi:hypothetical protein
MNFQTTQILFAYVSKTLRATEFLLPDLEPAAQNI